MASKDRIANLPWQLTADRIAREGFALIPRVFTSAECAGLRGLFNEKALFSKTTVMETKGYGLGEYGYFKTPPPEITALRETFYEKMTPLANAWIAAAGKEAAPGAARFPDRYEDFAALCAQNGQPKNACLLLSYPNNGFNALHQDEYGPRKISFPFQMTVLLSRPGQDFSHGQFLLEEKERITAIDLQQGQAIVLPSVFRVARDGAASPVRHGVARIKGNRMTLGVIAHGHD